MVGWVVLFLSVSCLLPNSHGFVQEFNLSQVQKAGEGIRNWLTRQHNNYTHVDVLKKNMQGALVKAVELRPEMDKARDTIVKLFESKRQAVQNLVDALEEATKTYTWEDKLDSNFSSALYMNGSEYRAADVLFNASLTPDPLLGGVPTLRSVAGVHLPVEVYQGYPEIVNGVAWSQCLDEVFIENTARDYNISWQYFAASSGFMRLYPATKWPVPPELGGADLYDARRRSWFVRGSTLPKDIVILMDRSGSVHGQTFTIMKFAVKTLINTLGEDDFVNVAVFNESVEWAINCTDALDGDSCNSTATLMQATTDNKLKLFRTIDELTDGGMTNYTRALEFAYEKVIERSAEVDPEASNCHRLIMIFSDGGTDQAQEVMDKYRKMDETRNVRIFTYAIGPHPIPTVVLKEMSCQTGGLFTAITSASGVRNLIQDSYLPVLWRSEYLLREGGGVPLREGGGVPLGNVSDAGLHDDNTTAATSSKGYIHHLAQPPSLKLKRWSSPMPHGNTPYIDTITERLSIAITQPVYNQSALLNSSTSSPPLVGVAGVDLPITEIESRTVTEALGPTGYFFLVNHNGFVAMHPRLKTQHFYLQDPPNRDLLDLEWPSPKIDMVRQHMVNGNEEKGDIGIIIIKHSHLLTDERHLVAANDDFQYWFEPVNKTSYSLGMVVRNRSMYLTVPEHNDSKYTFDNYTTRLPHWILPNEPSPRPGLVWSERWTDSMVLKWRQNHKFTFVADKLLAFTRFGLTRFHAKSMTWPDWLNAWLDPRHNPSLKRAEFGEEVSLFPNGDNILMTSPVSKKGLVVATVGINFYNYFVREGVLQELQKVGLTDGTVTSMLLDDGAFIVVGQIDEVSSGPCAPELLTGSFIGDSTGGRVLLDYLLEKGIYQYISYVDQQAVCGPPPPPSFTEVNSAPLTRPPLFHHSLPLALTSVEGFLSFISQAYYLMIGFLFSVLLHPARSLTEFGIMSFDGMPIQPCVMKRTVYTWGKVNKTAIPVDCGLEKGEILASRIENTNLLLISIIGCPVEKAVLTVKSDEEGAPEFENNIYEGFNSTDILDQQCELMRFSKAFAAKVTGSVPPGPEEERLPESKWCCGAPYRRNARACRKGVLPANNTCSSGGDGLTVYGRTGPSPTALLASVLSCLIAAHLARY